MSDENRSGAREDGLPGRVVLVSGAAGGVGAATVARLARSGARVHGIDLDEEGLARNRKQLAVEGLDTSWTAVDVADPAAVSAAVSETVAAEGGLDAVVAAHGLNSVEDDGIADLDLALYHRIVDVNLGGVVHLAKYATPALRRSGHGVFVAVSSVAAHLAPSGPAYAAAKGGISSLVRILAHELAADGVRCVAITPGPINTPMMYKALAKRGLSTMTMPPGALQRIGEPADVAALVRFLVSDEASFITGSNVTIDGGVTPF